MSRTFALIPAAGKSSRMGRVKLALPLGSRTVLEHVIDTLRGAGIDHILVVVGPHVGELVDLAVARGAQTLLLEHETADMRATVEEGLRWIADRWNPGENDGWLLLPADHPTLDSAVVSALLAAKDEYPNQSLFIPTYENRRGHPTWIAWKHLGALRAFRKDAGLNEFFRTLSSETREVPVASASVLWDLDTPMDYEQALKARQTSHHLKTT